MKGDLNLAAKLLGDAGQPDIAIARYTTYKLGGPAALFVEAPNLDTLELLGQAVMQSEVDVLVVGKGSNMLVADRGFEGIVVNLTGDFTSIEVNDSEVTAGAAVSLPMLARRSVGEGLTGFEWAVGVPGSVGGAVRMNAGGHGSQISENLVRFALVDLHGGPDGDKPAHWLGHGYRHSVLEAYQVVTFATLALGRGDKAKGEAEISEIVKWRRENQPGGRNAGSVFTNPVGDSAGRLIERAGMKGVENGSATVSPKHANFIQSSERGKSADVLELMKKVREAVLTDSGVLLKPEVRLIGFTAEELEGLQ